MGRGRGRGGGRRGKYDCPPTRREGRAEVYTYWNDYIHLLCAVMMMKMMMMQRWSGSNSATSERRSPSNLDSNKHATSLQGSSTARFKDAKRWGGKKTTGKEREGGAVRNF